MPHAFQAVSAIKQDLDNRNEYLGTELDVTAAYKVSKDIMVIGGYSQMFATETMVAIKGGAGLNGTTNNWAWVMININPQIFSSK
jgi:hypothetical protein